MPRAKKMPAPESHSSEVDELADDAPQALEPSLPPRPGRPAPGITRTPPANSLGRFRYNGPAPARLDENIPSARPSTTAASPAKRPRSKPATSLDSVSKRHRTAQRATPPRAEPRPDKGKQKAVADDEAVFYLPELDEDGEPICPDSSHSPAIQPAVAARSPARSPFCPATRSSPAFALHSLQRSPLRPTLAGAPPVLPSHASRLVSPVTARSPAKRHPPSSIELPAALLERVYARVSPSPHGSDVRSSSPFVPLALVAGGSGAKRASSQRLTSEQQEEVSMLCAGLEMDLEADELEDDSHVAKAAQTSSAHERRSEGIAVVDEAEHEEQILVEAVAAPLPKEVSAPSPPASTLSSTAHEDPFANDVPIPSPLPVLPTSFLRSPTPPLPHVHPVRAPRAPTPAPAPGGTSHVVANPFYRATTPPPRPAGYRLVALTASGLAEHARAVADAAAASAQRGGRGGEAAFLRGEVARLVRELDARDALLGAREDAARAAAARAERCEARARASDDDRRACEAKVDVLREVRRGLLAQLDEERARVGELEARLAALEGAAGVGREEARGESLLATQPDGPAGVQSDADEVDQLDEVDEPAGAEEATRAFDPQTLASMGEVVQANEEEGDTDDA